MNPFGCIPRTSLDMRFLDRSLLTSAEIGLTDSVITQPRIPTRIC